MTPEEIKEIYEQNTSRVVIESSAQSLHDYDAIDEAILEFGRIIATRAYETAEQIELDNEFDTGDPTYD